MTRFYDFAVKSEREKFKDFEFNEIFYGGKKTFLSDNLSVETETAVFSQAVQARKVYCTGGKKFLFGSDGILYEFTNNKIKAVIEKVFFAPPVLFSVFYMGEKYTAVSDGANIYLVGGDFRAPFALIGDSFAYVCGRLFSLKGNLLSFTELTSESGVIGVKNGGSINLGDEGGYLVSENSSLFIFCKSAVYELSVKGSKENFVLKKISGAPMNIVCGTAKKIKNEIYFISEGGLYAYSSGNITLKYRQDFAFDVTGDAVRCGTYYVLPVKTGGKSAFFLYDVYSGEAFAAYSENFLVSDGGFAVNTQTGEAGEFFRLAGEELFIGRPVDFGYDAEKYLTGVSVKGEGEAEITVNGDFGQRRIRIKAGEGKRRLNLVSKSFAFRISKGGFNRVSRVRLYYRTRGDV